MWFCILAFVACSSDDTPDVPPVGPVVPESPVVAVEAGEPGETSVEITLSAKNANWLACMHVPEYEAEEEPTALDVFRRDEFVAEVSEGAGKYLIEGLKPGTTYIIYAAARMDEEYSGVESVRVTTAPASRMLSFVEADKSSFSYRVSVPEGTVFQHCYIEGWYFDYMLATQQQVDGPEFDMNVFLWNMLVDLGYQAEGPQDIRWRAGDENVKHGDIAMIVGGKKYYALCSLFEPENNWLGTPEYEAFETAPAGVSDATVKVIVEEASSAKVRVRMEADPATVHFFYYDLYVKESFDVKKEADGQSGVMDYLYEYGHPVANTYTDVWNVDPDRSYMLAIMGVDHNGDLFYVEQQIDSERQQTVLSVDMRPFERELQGYHAYDTFEVTVTAENFGEINAESALWIMQPRAQIDAMLGELGGLTFDMLAEALETDPGAIQYLMMLNPMPLQTEWADRLVADGYFMAYLSDNYDDTEYYFVCALPHDGIYKLSYATARTETMPQSGETDEQYKAYLGEWKLEGQSTEDYYTRKSYMLRFEELTPNRSYKVYGWGDSDVAQKYPFEVRYHADTKKISIEGHQILGIEMLGDKQVQVLFEGFLMANGGLQLVDDFTSKTYIGSLNGDRLSLFPEYVVLAERYYEFRTMAYAGYDATNDAYYAFPGDDYQVVNFMVNRASQPAAKSSSAVAPGAKARVLRPVPWRPESRRIEAAPVIRDASAKQPMIFGRR